MLSNSAFWQTQHALHGKDSNALPTALLVVAGVLVTYRHMTQEAWEGNQLKTFLALIMIQMMPLVLIEIKIPSCPDPMALLSQFGSKVLLMHACVLGPRCVFNMAYHGSFWDIFHFAGVCFALYQGFGFRLTLQNIYAHRHVVGLVLLAIMTAVIEETISYMALTPWQRRKSWKLGDLVVSACNYSEILAFVPAVWMVYQNKADMCPGSPKTMMEDTTTQTKALYLFAFLLGFYFCEDLGSIPSLWRDLPLAAVAHAAHFLLVLDFAAFMLAHIYNPEKIKEGLMKMTASFGAGTLV